MSVSVYVKVDYKELHALKAAKNKANFNCRIGRRVDSRLRGNDKYGIPARRRILARFEKTSLY